MPWLSFIQDGRGIVTVPQNRYEMLADLAVDLLKNKVKIEEIGLEGKKQIIDIAEKNIDNAWVEFFETISKKGKVVKKCNNADIIFKYLTLFQYEGREKIVQNLQKRNELLKRESDRLEKELNIIKQRDLQIIKKQAEVVSCELNSVKTGWSFRIGRIITFVPRKIRDWLKNNKI